MSAIAETEHARSEQLDNPESIYRACADMKLFNQEVLRVILLDTRYRHISTVEITKAGLLNWRDRCRARGQAFLAEIQSLAKDRPQQLTFRFQLLS